MKKLTTHPKPETMFPSLTESELEENDESEKTVTKPMLEMPLKSITPFRTIWNLDTMTPLDVEELILAAHKRFGHVLLRATHDDDPYPNL